MKSKIMSIIKKADQKLSLLSLKVVQESNALIILMFHGLFLDESEMISNVVVAPQQGVTVKHFNDIVEYFSSHEYTFIAPDDILGGLNQNKRYILITFDDGYYNNVRALPILNKFQAPAVFFIATNHMLKNKSFWWDVLFRERRKQGKSISDVLRESQQLKAKTDIEIEEQLVRWFGRKALQPLSDLDRPFNPTELKQFAREKMVFLGNHTSNHAILPNYKDDDSKMEISFAQNTLYELTGELPVMIAYPDGKYSDRIINISEREGLRLGVTTEPRKNYFPVDFTHGEQMRLGRFTPRGSTSIRAQCELARSDLQLYSRLRSKWNDNKRKAHD